MTWKLFLLRFAGLILLAALAWPLYAITVNGLLWFDLISPELIEQGYGHALTLRMVFVWLTAIAAAFASIFVKDDWRLVLYLSPLYTPSLFAIAYTLVQR